MDSRIGAVSAADCKTLSMYHASLMAMPSVTRKARILKYVPAWWPDRGPWSGTDDQHPLYCGGYVLRPKDNAHAHRMLNGNRVPLCCIIMNAVCILSIFDA